jgi:hypothetical protein
MHIWVADMHCRGPGERVPLTAPLSGVIFSDNVQALQAYQAVSLIISEYLMGCLCVKSGRYSVCICDIRFLVAYFS